MAGAKILCADMGLTFRREGPEETETGKRKRDNGNGITETG